MMKHKIPRRLHRTQSSRMKKIFIFFQNFWSNRSGKNEKKFRIFSQLHTSKIRKNSLISSVLFVFDTSKNYNLFETTEIFIYFN